MFKVKFWFNKRQPDSFLDLEYRTLCELPRYYRTRLLELFDFEMQKWTLRDELRKLLRSRGAVLEKDLSP